MHVFGGGVDVGWFLQFIATPLIIVFGLHQLLRNTASKYLAVDANFGDSDSSANPNDVVLRPDSTTKTGIDGPWLSEACVVCGNLTKKQCSGCKSVKYCSEACQRSDWHAGHKAKCKDFQSSGKANSIQSASVLRRRKISTSVPLISSCGTTKILFPYEEFVELFNSDMMGFPPCGLLNCGNSCFANVVLQCLAYTRPLAAYLLEKGHRRECSQHDWCFLCELQTHVERASQNRHAFSPINILSRLPNIGGNLGYGKQEDAHEFMRFAIDTMQSVCLDEFGGEKAVPSSSQETTLIQHIFGGHLESQVVCTICNKVSNQLENMMDLTVEIHGDAVSLEQCLDQFTARERLHGDNMYKCDGCNDYVLAWKRLTVRRAPNILTIALKRFQGGRFGKLNKRVTFPETLDLSPYMSEAGDGNDVYKLYAVVVHVDMLNASFFGHYICYIKDFCRNWYRIDDCKVERVDLDEVLSEGAYMLLYSRICAQQLPLCPDEPSRKEEQEMKKVVKDVEACPKPPVKGSFVADIVNIDSTYGSLLSGKSLQPKVSGCEDDLSSLTHYEDIREGTEMVYAEARSSISKDVEVFGNGCPKTAEEIFRAVDAHKLHLGVTSLTDEFSTGTSVMKHAPISPIYDF